MRLILVLVLAGLASGCAGRNYFYQIPSYETPRTIPDFYEVGEVVGVELVAPSSRVPYDCEDSYDGFDGYHRQYCQYSSRVRDAVPLRGADGIIDFFPGGRLLFPFAVENDFPDDTISLEAARSLGWRIYNTVRLDNADEVTVVASEDRGFSIGELVRIGFNNSILGSLSNRVYLLGSDEEDVAEIVVPREPPGPWGRINAQLEQELSLRSLSARPVDLLYKDLKLLKKDEEFFLTVSGARLLRAIEDEYVDFTLGVRSDEELRDPIGVIFETNLGFGIRKAWNDYAKNAIPEFASWFESTYLPD